jgi:hypothetical protein
MTAEGGRAIKRLSIEECRKRPGLCLCGGTHAERGVAYERYRAAQPSESEREGAQPDERLCAESAGHEAHTYHDFRGALSPTEAKRLGFCGASPPSTGQSREQRLEEALDAVRPSCRARGCWCPAGWDTSQAHSVACEIARRALESKP